MAGFDWGSITEGTGTLVSAGLSAYGTMESSQASKEQAQISKKITGLEMQVEDQRKTAMELSARRQQMEIVRHSQVARAMALNNATNQGAQFGSGLQGGYGSIGGQTGVNLLGVSQNLEIGENLFAINRQIDYQKMAMADAKSKEAEGQGFSSLSKSISTALPAVGKIAANFLPALAL